MSAVATLLARWRTATHGDADVRDVLARGSERFAVEGRAAADLTLMRCMEQLADAMQTDACLASPEVDEPAIGDHAHEPSLADPTRCVCGFVYEPGIPLTHCDHPMHDDDCDAGCESPDDHDEPADLEDDGFALASAFGPNDDDCDDIYEPDGEP